MREYPEWADDEPLENCGECGKELAEDNASGFCCEAHAREYAARLRAADDAYALALMEEAKHAAEWREEQRRERERRLTATVLDRLEGKSMHDTFEIPARLTPSTAMGLTMTMHYMKTPPNERV